MKQNQKHFIIVTIDGPGGVGKSTVTQKIAENLHLLKIDTGAMYRCFALTWTRQGQPDDEASLRQIGDSIQIEFQENGDVYCNGEDVSMAIREETISQITSKVSTFPVVRLAMQGMQRALAETTRQQNTFKGVVLEGRDTGTKVFPKADVKFFLSASPEIRAERRYLQLQAKGLPANRDQIQRDIIERDERDMNRAQDPLRKAEDAIDVDTSNLTQDEVIKKMTEIIRQQTQA